MNKKLLFRLFSWVFLLSNTSFAQKNIVNVNPLTGAGSVVIPIYQINRGQVSLPIRLVYSGTGIRPKDVEGTAGMGWQLQAGGQIQRKVRGLPDDVMKDNAGNTRLGWIYNTNAAKISGFSIANDNNPATCTDGTSDVNYITSNFADYSDTEPDIFYVNAPGLSCELVFDQASGQFKPVNYQDIKISYNAYSSTATYAGQITSITITNDKGIAYTFSFPDQIKQAAISSSPTYFKNVYNQYNNQYNTGLTYFNNWHLSSIADNGGTRVILHYSAAPTRNGTDAVSLYMPGATTAALQYKTNQSVTAQILSQVEGEYDIDNPADVLTLTWSQNTFSTGGTGQSMISSITGAGVNLQFGYFNETHTYTLQGGNYTRYFLHNLTDSRCSSPVNYTFNYAGENQANFTTTLPDSATFKVDYWGYFADNTNTSLMPKVWISAATSTLPQYAIYETGTSSALYPYYTTNGNIRAADAANVMAGSLNKITYAEGGTSTLTYESNDYVDYPSGTVVQGNGVRVKQIVDDDGFGTGNSITRNYSYLNPGTGVSSGVPLSLPAYAFNVPYSGGNTGNSLWNSATVVSDNDLSKEDHTIMYSYVKESQTGAGSTLYQYYVPAGYWSTAAGPACSGCSGISDYNATINNIQQITCPANTGPVANNMDGYPFSSNENYDFERGLIQKETNYNDAGTEVSETSYTYQRSYTPTGIACLKWEDNPFPDNTSGARAFGKYITNYTTSELVTQVVKKVFDSPTLSQAQTSTTNYAYNSANHKLVTQQQVTNSDNSVLTTNYQYVKDFLATSSANRNINALYNLQLQNINIPVETWQQVTRAGVTKTTAASLNYYLDFPSYNGLYKYRPSASYKFFSAAGVTDFVPSNISGTALNQYRGYYAAANYTGYNMLGDLQTADDAHQHVTGAVLDNISGQPAVTIANAAAGEMFFADFDSDIVAPWTVTKSGTSAYTAPAGSHNYNAAGLGTGQSFSCTLTKNALAGNYLFSAWVNSSAAGNITFTLTPAAGSAVTSTQTLASTVGAWKYLEWKVPVSGISGTFTLAVSANINLGVDDMLFYPETAEVTTYAYDPVTHFKTAVTNTNGVSVYYTDDTYGRLVYTMDQDHNIIKKNTYVTGQMVQDWGPASVAKDPYNNIYKNIATTFSVGGYDQCETAGTVVNWTFGDGGSASSALTSSPQHTYTATGNYTVSATVYSPIFGSKVATPLTVTVYPTPINLTFTNNTNYINNAMTTTLYSPATGQTYTFQGTGSGTVPPDTYNIHVAISGGAPYNATTGTGYAGILVNGDCVYLCQDYVSGNFAQFNGVNISTCTHIDISVNRLTCLDLSM